MATLTAYIEFDEETRLFLELCLAEDEDLRARLPKFVGVQQIEVA